jgi:ATP-dependent DNA helicase RecG
MERENINTEFKKEFVKDIVKTIVAFANTNGGKIYIGVDDSGEAVGLENGDQELLKLTNAARDSINPDITPFTSSFFEMIDGKTIIVYEVQKGTACPYYIKGKGLRPEGVYVRQGASSVPVSQSAILKMIKETDGDCYEDLRSLNQNLKFEVLKKEFKSTEILLEEPQMKTLKIIADDELYTNLGLLLSDQCQHTIKAAVFEGTSKNLFKDRYEFTGSVLRQMWEAYAFLDRYNRTQSTFKGIQRIDFREYPEIALREALLNSIVHKDYSFSSSTLISVFDDRIEILTVGGLVKGITKEDILMGTSILRNKNLANIFYRLRLIEAYGTGIPKIRESYENYDVQPKIEITDNAVKITLPAIHIQQKENNLMKKFNVSETRILEMLNEKESIRRSDIEHELSISQPMAIKLLKVLLSKNAIERMGSGRNTYYILKI